MQFHEVGTNVMKHVGAVKDYTVVCHVCSCLYLYMNVLSKTYGISKLKIFLAVQFNIIFTECHVRTVGILTIFSESHGFIYRL